MMAGSATTVPRHPEPWRPEDLETASIRSTAPSDVSDVPSYHTHAFPLEPIPPYAPREQQHPATPRQQQIPCSVSFPASASVSPETHRYGLPPIPATHDHMTMLNYSIPTWSSFASNPNARQYYRVAQRRANSQVQTRSDDSLRRLMLLQRLTDDDGRSQRTWAHEDSHPVGEEVTAQAYTEGLARERRDGMLDEDARRWDRFIEQMRQQSEREANWNKFRKRFDDKHKRGVGFGRYLRNRIGLSL